MVRQEGFEPPTFSFEGCCSIQLSYWRVSVFTLRNIRPKTVIVNKSESSPDGLRESLEQGNQSLGLRSK